MMYVKVFQAVVENNKIVDHDRILVSGEATKRMLEAFLQGRTLYEVSEKGSPEEQLIAKNLFGAANNGWYFLDEDLGHLIQYHEYQG